MSHPIIRASGGSHSPAIQRQIRRRFSIRPQGTDAGLGQLDWLDGAIGIEIHFVGVNLPGGAAATEFKIDKIPLFAVSGMEETAVPWSKNFRRMIACGNDVLLRRFPRSHR